MMKENGECSYDQWREEWFLVSREGIMCCLCACAWWIMNTLLSPLQFTFWFSGVWLPGPTLQHPNLNYSSYSTNWLYINIVVAHVVLPPLLYSSVFISGSLLFYLNISLLFLFIFVHGIPTFCHCSLSFRPTTFIIPISAPIFLNILSDICVCRSGPVIAADPRQHSQSWFRVPRDSWPYFTVSQLCARVYIYKRAVYVTYPTQLNPIPLLLEIFNKFSEYLWKCWFIIWMLCWDIPDIRNV
jgi:hypothetical protein